jgi:hypothetical protein
MQIFLEESINSDIMSLCYVFMCYSRPYVHIVIAGVLISSCSVFLMIEITLLLQLFYYIVVPFFFFVFFFFFLFIYLFFVLDGDGDFHLLEIILLPIVSLIDRQVWTFQSMAWCRIHFGCCFIFFCFWRLHTL